MEVETVGYAGLKANLSYAENRLAAHRADEVDLIMEVEKVKEQINALNPNKFQTVFDEENFIDAVWFLQDEPEIKDEARAFLNWKSMLENKLKTLGVDFNK